MAVPSSSPASDHAILVDCGNGEGRVTEPLLGTQIKNHHYTCPEAEGEGEGEGASTTTSIRTCFNGLNALSGVGILSIPYALSEGGWLSLILLFSVAIVCYYTGILLQRCMDVNPHIKTYPDIGGLAFGNKGRLAVSILMYMELYLVAVGFLILEGDNLDKLFPHTSIQIGSLHIAGKKFFVVLIALLILPTTWLRSLGVLAYVSAGGVMASIIVVVSVFWAATFEGVGFHARGTTLKLSGLPTSVGLYAFCYCGHAVFPTIYTSMKDKSKFPKVLIICFALCTLNYGSMAVFGYLMYGDNVESQVTLNLPVGKLSSKIAIYTTLINPFTKYALMILPFASALEEKLLAFKKRSNSILLRTLLVFSTVVIAVEIPFFGYLMALIGSFLSVSVSFLLPCLCYIKIFRMSQHNMFELAIILGIFVLGILIAVMGTYTAIWQIIQEF